MGFRRKRQSTVIPVPEIDPIDPRWSVAAQATVETPTPAPVRGLSDRATQGLAVQKLRLGRNFVEPVAAVAEPVDQPEPVAVDEPTEATDEVDDVDTTDDADPGLVITSEDLTDDGLTSDDELIATDDAAVYPSSSVVELATDSSDSTDVDDSSEPADTDIDEEPVALVAVPNAPELAQA